MTDLVVGLIRGYDWPMVRTFANSLARSGFTGTKVMFVDSVTARCRANLAALGFDVIDATVAAPPDFLRMRYAPVVEWLAKNVHRFRYIVWAGPRDVVFQTNPSEWMDKHIGASLAVVGAGEGWLIKNEIYNDMWVKEQIPEFHNWLREYEVLCADTITGTARYVFEVMQYINTLMHESPNGTDQSALNLILRTDPYKEFLYVPRMSDGFIATWYAEKQYDPAKLIPDYGTPVFSAHNATVYTPDGVTPFSIVHQYDRCPVWKQLVDAKYGDA